MVPKEVFEPLAKSFTNREPDIVLDVSMLGEGLSGVAKYALLRDRLRHRSLVRLQLGSRQLGLPVFSGSVHDLDPFPQNGVKEVDLFVESRVVLPESVHRPSFAFVEDDSKVSWE